MWRWVEEVEGGRVVFSSAATDANEGGVSQGAGGARGPRREPPYEHATGRTLCRQVSWTTGDNQPVPARRNARPTNAIGSALLSAFFSERVSPHESESVGGWVDVGGRQAGKAPLSGVVGGR